MLPSCGRAENVYAAAGSRARCARLGMLTPIEYELRHSKIQPVA